MRLLIDVKMDYRIEGTSALLTLDAARTAGQRVTDDALHIDGARVSRIAGQDGIGQRIWAHLGGNNMNLTYHAEVEVTRSAAMLENLAAAPLHDLPGEVLPYLRPSRYCQSDMFGGFVARRFDGLSGGARVAAIRNWVFEQVSYIPASSNGTTTALDTFAMREGVCRDYAHMVCGLARASNIPARYVSAYGLGVTPPDFHAVAEVWLEDGWHLVDATGMCSPDGLVIVGVGRDACDTAFMETDAPAQMNEQTVSVAMSES